VQLDQQEQLEILARRVRLDLKAFKVSKVLRARLAQQGLLVQLVLKEKLARRVLQEQPARQAPAVCRAMRDQLVLKVPQLALLALLLITMH
jgi:hypothetical protein